MFKFMSFCMFLWLNFWANLTNQQHPAPGPVNRLLNRPVRRVARSTGWQTGPSGLSSGWTGPHAGLPSSSHNSVKTLEYMLCSLASLFPDDMYTYSTAIFALFAHSQVIQVMRPVVLFPREGGMRGLQDVAQALECLAEQLRAVVQVVQLQDEPRQWPRERKTNMQLKRMILLRECQHTMWAQCILLIGEDSERRIPIGSRKGLILVKIGNFGPTLK